MANNYNPYIPYYNFQNTPMQTQNNGINWVQGIEGAYLLIKTCRPSREGNSWRLKNTV